MFFEAIIIAIIIGYSMGGRLSALQKLDFKFIYLIFVSFLIQGGIDFWADRVLWWGYPVLYIASYFLLLFAVYKNRRIRGMHIIILGMLFNFLVIVINGGFMPVRQDILPQHLLLAFSSGHGGTHGLLTEATRLRQLADIFYIALPYQKQLVSIGDLVIDFGVIILLIKGMGQGNRLRI